MATLFARTDKNVGTVPTCSWRMFSPANFNQSRCRILVFASCRPNKVAKWKTGLKGLLARSQQEEELDLLEEGSVTEPFGDILVQQQVENTCQSISNAGIEQG